MGSKSQDQHLLIILILLIAWLYIIWIYYQYHLLTKKYQESCFIKPLMAEQRRHVSCVGESGSWTHAVRVKFYVLTAPRLRLSQLPQGAFFPTLQPVFHTQPNCHIWTCFPNWLCPYSCCCWGTLSLNIRMKGKIMVTSTCLPLGRGGGRGAENDSWVRSNCTDS